jgi:hypothetical protein
MPLDCRPDPVRMQSAKSESQRTFVENANSGINFVAAVQWRDREGSMDYALVDGRP